tara:strand:+ start:678 stop:872 length:195 start_codon:yes stop_codon:yes gene_type:complete
MKNVICLQEYRLKKQLTQAYRELTDVRTLISSGDHHMIEDAIRIENKIVYLEDELLSLTQRDYF